MDWVDSDENDFMRYSDKIGVIWSRSFHGSNTIFRKARLTTGEAINSLLGKAYLPWYHNASFTEDPEKFNKFSPGAMNYEAREYLQKQAARISKIEKPAIELVVITAYDREVRKRLIVDGCHSCISVMMFGLEGNGIKAITVLEAYGDGIKSVFIQDFACLIGNRPRLSKFIWLKFLGGLRAAKGESPNLNT